MEAGIPRVRVEGRGRHTEGQGAGWRQAYRGLGWRVEAGIQRVGVGGGGRHTGGQV